MILAFRSNHQNTEPAIKVILKDTQPVPAPAVKPAAIPKPAVKANPKKKPAPEVAVSSASDGPFLIDASLNGPGNPYTSARRQLNGRTDSIGPLVFVNGKEYTLPLNTLDVNLIESVNVYKDQQAIEKFGPKRKNGVIEIITREPFISISWEKIFIGSITSQNGRQLSVKKEFTDSLNRLREEKGFLYVGIYNVAAIKVKDVDPANVTVQIDNATVIRENSTFTITAKSPGKTVLKIYATNEKGDKKEIYQHEITVVYLPTPGKGDIVIN
jgi:hypothetical protein